MWDSKSGLAFLKRSGLIPMHRGPEPQIAPDALLAHTLPLSNPLPLPALLTDLDGTPPPDRGVTTDWPNEQMSNG